jgi:hypothetical protein
MSAVKIKKISCYKLFDPYGGAITGMSYISISRMGLGAMHA